MNLPRWIAAATLGGSLLFSLPLFATDANDVWKKVGEAKAPPPRVVLRRGDRLALCGDSITEQRQYSRIIETYLTACSPELELSVRQFGWSGEKVDGFFARMDNDVLRFHPTVATTCYGMNDHLYRPFEPWIGELYRAHSDSMVRWFQRAGVRVVVGSPGCVGKMPSWVKSATGTVEDLNLSLAHFRNLDVALAKERQTGFADVFTPMYRAFHEAHGKYGEQYAVPGADGVHPDWAGQTIMAYAFLKSLGVDGNLGVITVNPRSGKATATGGHRVTEARPGRVSLQSSRYVFCAPTGDLAKHDSIRSGWQWVPFNQDLNRLTLVVKGAQAARYKVTWGATSRSYSADELRRGVNLAADFAQNPFVDAFQRVDAAVAAKQEFETRQIKQEFHGERGRQDMEGTVRRTEAERDAKVKAVKEAFTPVDHVLEIAAE
jgi:lysophospholipase L1-like esterase